MTKLGVTFVTLEVLTAAMPFLIGFVFGRGVVQLSLLWALLLTLIVSSIAMFRRNRALAVSGFIIAGLTFCFMMVIPSFVG